MEKVTLSAEARAKLEGTKEPVDLCDETGAVVGVGLSAEAYRRMLVDLIPPITPEDRAEALKELDEGRCLTTAEVLAGLHAARREWEARR